MKLDLKLNRYLTLAALIMIISILFACSNSKSKKSNIYIFTWENKYKGEKASVFVEFILNGKSYGVGFDALYEISKINIYSEDEIKIVIPKYQEGEFFSIDYYLPFFECGLLHRWNETGACIKYIFRNKVMKSHNLTWEDYDGIMVTPETTEATRYIIDGNFLGNGKSAINKLGDVVEGNSIIQVFVPWKSYPNTGPSRTLPFQSKKIARRLMKLNIKFAVYFDMPMFFEQAALNGK